MNFSLFKKIVKSWVPPILLEKQRQLRVYSNFISYKNTTSKNSQLKDKHSGQRCFILGSGPSIKKEDLSVLKDEIVFALNNFYVHNDFKTIVNSNIEKYYMVAPIHAPQTNEEWQQWFCDMDKNIPDNVQMLMGLDSYKANSKRIFEKNNLFKNNDVFWFFSGREYKSSDLTLNGLDMQNIVYSGETVSIYALIAAIYMGFSEIYLLGMDHDYFLYDDESNMRMYKSAIHQKDEFKRTFGDDFYIREFKRQYLIFQKYKAFYTHTNAEIINLSDGGILKLFPRQKLSDII